MSRINNNVASLTAQRGLAKSQKSLADTLQRLSTGLRINRGADDPAGLITSEGLRSEIAGINQAINNSQRASNVIATTEAALQEVGNLLLNVKSLIVEGANTGALSRSEIEANQLQIDSAIESITRIANTTTFAGLKLLDGSLDYITSGVNTTDVDLLRVKGANFAGAEFIPVSVDVIASARPAEIQFRGSAIASTLTLEVAGLNGVDTLTFVSSTSIASVMSAVNLLSDQTGINARLINSANANSGITFYSTVLGSRAFVSVAAQGGSFNTVDTTGSARARTVGQDAVATINGALTTGDGARISLNTTQLDLDITLASGFGVGDMSFTITGGGSLFQLGPKVIGNQQVNIGIPSVAASKLGDRNIGFLNELSTGGGASLVAENGTSRAGEIIEVAIRQIATLRGRLGAFEKNTIDTNIASLSVALENVTASESDIRDADFAYETSQLTRAQILQQAGTTVLATANSTPQTVLSLLQG
jgi:flagellin